MRENTTQNFDLNKDGIVNSTEIDAGVAKIALTIISKT